MTIESTVEAIKAKDAERDFAPLSSRQTAARASEELTVTHPLKTEELIHLEPVARKKTSGEKIFNIGTYVGVGLLGNEATSLWIGDQAGKTHWFGRSYSNFQNFCRKLKTGDLLSSGIKEHLPTYVTGDYAPSLVELKGAKPRLPTLLYACIGGMLMVLPIKWLEDHKGTIVRKFDTWIHGKKAEEEPEMVEAHAEMDAAPKQTWGSLGTGRVITVLAALASDATFGWRHSLSAKLFENTPIIKHVRSLDHIADQVAFKAVDLFATPKGQKLTIPEKVAKPLYEKVNNGTWLLTLSGALTGLFYVTSKLMAQKEQKAEKNKSLKREGRAVASRDEAMEAPIDEAAPSIALLDQSRPAEKTVAAGEPCGPPCSTRIQPVGTAAFLNHR